MFDWINPKDMCPVCGAVRVLEPLPNPASRKLFSSLRGYTRAHRVRWRAGQLQSQQRTTVELPSPDEAMLDLREGSESRDIPPCKGVVVSTRKPNASTSLVGLALLLLRVPGGLHVNAGGNSGAPNPFRPAPGEGEREESLESGLKDTEL